ncbi:SDR family oxidoreductase [Paenarthrobacter ureafaciens]|uniref:SDR family oxidoreductase n=1 Tax=Paenarthrobacter ureafaciens TaxID=37931 RepID=UPI002DB5EB88|nr:SDR family oxidoreductase [Paenarthrobacter ureafaciens]MEC3853697.1 SDR family oxidoreductase [Paenarthrobacter ureafaciens]
MAGRVDGKRIFITGAGSGMGRAVALSMAAEGALLTIFDLNAEAAEKVSQEIVADGGRAIATSGNVVERKDVAAAVAAGVEEYGGLDVMFAIAGIIRPMHFLDVTEENWRTTLDVNGLGTLICQQEAAKQMIAQGTGGKLILTSSIAGRQGYPNFAPYCASKFAVNSLVQAAARGLAEHRITCNAFAPGVVDTPLWRKLDLDIMELGDTSAPGQAFEEFSGSILAGRPGTPEDVTGTALYLASSDSDYMTGQVVMIDGGMVLV